MKNMVASTAIILCASLLLTAHAKETKHANRPPDALAVQQAVAAFSKAINRLDLEGVAQGFSEDATVFYPFSFTPHRLNSREEAKAAQAKGFEWARKNLPHPDQTEPLTLGLTPSDMHIQMLGAEAAVATWHANRSTHAGRRTAVLQKVNDKWLIVSLHASNLNYPKAEEKESAKLEIDWSNPPKPLYEYDWTKWLVGDWEGSYEGVEGKQRLTQSFEFAVDGRYILTKLVLGEGDKAYKGIGVFAYYPEQDSACGNWFGLFYDTNDGTAKREGNKMIWNIQRLGRQTTRIREKVGEDEYVVTNETTMPDGQVVLSKEIMRRQSPALGAR